LTGDVPAGVAAFIALLGVALLISIAAERIRLPAAVLLVAAGTIAGSAWHVQPPFAFGPAVLFVFLPPLIFEAGWHLDLTMLREHAGRIAFLALPGTLVSAFAVAGVLALTGVLPFGAALLLGAIVSATDPVAVVAVFRRAAVPPAVKAIVEAESLANDGVAVVIFGIALAALEGHATDWLPAIGAGALDVLGGTAIGALCAIPFWLMVRGARALEHEVTATIALAYVAYLAADRAGCSGIFATAAAAIALRALLHRRAYMANRDDVNTFWDSAAYIANGAVFLATGLAIDFPRTLHEPLLVVSVVAAIAVARIALSAAAGADRAARITIFLAGMRGALPLALALAIPAGTPYRAQLIDGVFAVVVVTLVLQGMSLEPVVQRLYGTAGAASEPQAAHDGSAR
jgi:CPA1 family monovalent cation:H+ antiporter